jgi:RNase P protein component
MIEKIWEYPSVWLVFIVKQGYTTLPTANLDEELKQFIAEKVRKNNGGI